MGKIFKPFFKYNSILAIFVVLYQVLIIFNVNYLFYNNLIYMPLLVIIAPITFGIQYGSDISKNSSLTFSQQLILGTVIFVINYITYLIPFAKWIWTTPGTFLQLTNHTLLPAALMTIVFYCSILYQKLQTYSLKENRFIQRIKHILCKVNIFNVIPEILRPFFIYNTIILLIQLVYVCVITHNENAHFLFIIFIQLPFLTVLGPCIFGAWYGHKISKANDCPILLKLKISVSMFITNYIVYLIPFYKWYLYDIKKRNFGKLVEHLLFESQVEMLVQFPTILLTAMFVISLLISPLFSKKRREARQ